MRIASQRQERALLLMQIAQECPEFRDQAVYLAREWLEVAAVHITCLDLIKQTEKGDHPN
jgi:hypothetical protein